MPSAATVFIVDDDDAVRESLCILLEASGYPVAAFSGGAALLGTLSPAARGCVLVDLCMPGMGGFEVLQELRRRGVTIPVILISGHGDVPLAVRAMREGAADFIEKPFTEDLIRLAIDRALELDRASQDERAGSEKIRDRVALLTAREREVLDELVAGHPNKIIAYRLSISPRTVEIHRARVLEKMQAHSPSELVRMALEAGLPAASNA
jgi:two-component system, LuxR family, response regulator FixJ